MRTVKSIFLCPWMYYQHNLYITRFANIYLRITCLYSVVRSFGKPNTRARHWADLFHIWSALTYFPITLSQTSNSLLFFTNTPVFRDVPYQLVEITNKMQHCNRIYYSKFYRRLIMFWAAYHSSSGAPNYICNLWFIYPCGDRPLSRLDESSHPSRTTAGHHMGI